MVSHKNRLSFINSNNDINDKHRSLATYPFYSSFDNFGPK